MTKTHVSTSRKHSKGAQINTMPLKTYSNEQRIERLANLAERVLSSGDKAFALNLVDQYNLHGDLSEKQWFWVRRLVHRNKSKGKRTHEPHYVYAIAHGEHVKIGFSRDPKGRVRALQTAYPGHLTLRWSQKVPGRQQAKALEKRLHKRFKKYHIRGEWFHIDALSKMKGFSCPPALNPEHIRS